MRSETILIAGDTSLEALRELLAGHLPPDMTETEIGRTWGPGIISLTDAERDHDYYDDADGMPLSRYRFELENSRPDAEQWANGVYETLERETDLGILWLETLQRARASRPPLKTVRPAPGL